MRRGLIRREQTPPLFLLRSRELATARPLRVAATSWQEDTGLQLLRGWHLKNMGMRAFAQLYERVCCNVFVASCTTRTIVDRCARIRKAAGHISAPSLIMKLPRRVPRAPRTRSRSTHRNGSRPMPLCVAESRAACTGVSYMYVVHRPEYVHSCPITCHTYQVPAQVMSPLEPLMISGSSS